MANKKILIGLVVLFSVIIVVGGILIGVNVEKQRKLREQSKEAPYLTRLGHAGIIVLLSGLVGIIIISIKYIGVVTKVDPEVERNLETIKKLGFKKFYFKSIINAIKKRDDWVLGALDAYNTDRNPDLNDLRENLEIFLETRT